MRVLVLSWEYPPVMVGGLGRHVHALSTAMARAGHAVTVVTRHADGAALEERVEGVRVVRAPEDPPVFPLATPSLLAWTMAFNHALTRAAHRACQGNQFDIIHAHDWLVAHTAITLKEQLALPLVVTIHSTEVGRHQGWLPDEMNRCIHSVERWLGQEAHRILLCSEHMRDEVSRLLGLAPERLDVVPNGVDTQRWQAHPTAVRAARLRYAGAGPLIGYAGRLVYEKGVQHIIHALPELRRRHPGLRLVVAGDGPYRRQLREEADRLKLHRAVSFTGFLGAELPAVMAATDAMVVPSIYEPFGMIALEVAAAGAPLAVAATGGLAEIVTSGHTGVTFPCNDPPALAEAVSRLLSDEGEARRMASTARRIVADRYSWTAVAHGVARAYQAVSGPSRPAERAARPRSPRQQARPAQPAALAPQPIAAMSYRTATTT
jgi:glycogen(starch) synthase